MASSSGIPMPILEWDKINKQKAYQSWKDFLTSYLTIHKVDPADQWNYILISSGPRGRDLLESKQISEADKKIPAKVWKIFEDHLVEKPNKWVQRIELQGMTQKDTETVEEFVLRVTNKAENCCFSDANTRDERLTDQIIKGIKYPEEQKKLLAKGDALKLAEAITLAKAYEATVKSLSQYKSAAAATPTACDAIKKLKPANTKNNKSCQRCGRNHPIKKCPAYGTVCKKCNGKNHWASMCRSKQHTEQKQQTFKKVSELSTEFEEFKIDTITSEQRNQIFTRVGLFFPGEKRKCNVKVKVDTGANANLLTVRSLNQIYKDNQFPEMKKVSTKILAYNNEEISQLGTITVKDTNQNDIEFFVVDSSGPNILGLQDSVKLDLVKINCGIKQSNNAELDPYIKEYPDIFDGIGNLPGKFHITLKDEHQPVIQPPRKYPICIQKELKHELDQMETLGVIGKVTEPTDWVNSLAFSRKKNGKLRVCLDPKDLNTAIKRTHHKSPTIEEISHKFAGAKVFSKLDAQSGYLAVILDEESSLLTTFNSPFGRYKFLRLPFGLNVSQDHFQQMIDTILQDCPGTTGISDDIVVFGKNTEEHDKNLKSLFEKAREFGLVFNSKKCKIRQKEISFFGMVWNESGIHPDPEKCDQIHNKPEPKNTTELQSFLGMIQYLSSFIPNLSKHTDALRGLLQKDTEWQWNKSHKKAFKTLKDMVHKKLTINFYNPNKETTIEVDSSGYGCGAALIQEGRPVAFASKALSETEKRYANIEREMLAIVFACERFHTYIYGRHVKIETDHKPLEAIKKKNLAKAPPRLQRMLLRIQPYECEIKYKPGKEMVFADYLSRIQPTNGAEIELDRVINSISVTETGKEKMVKATEQDNILQCLKSQILEGWPESPQQVPKIIRGYFSMKDQLSTEDGLLLKGNTLIIPQNMKKEMLDKIHNGHLGQNKSILKAQDSVFWLGMNNEIIKSVKNCHICQEHGNSLAKQPIQQSEIPDKPFQYLAADIFDLNGQHFLLLCDYFSKMPFVKSLKNMTSSECISYMKSVFAIHGIPETLITDNAKQFTSHEFKNFSEEWEFVHKTSSPYYPRSNGFAERTVQTVKLCLKKATQSQQDPQLALLALRTTPIGDGLPSPTEILFNRKIKGALPIIQEKNQNMNIKQKLMQRQLSQKKYYNKHTKDLPDLVSHQKVYVQNNSGLWKPGVVVKKLKEPRSYLVKVNDAVYRRNRIHIKERYSDVEADKHEDEDIEEAEQPIQMPVTPQINIQRDNVQINPSMNTNETRSGRVSKKPEYLKDYVTK